MAIGKRTFRALATPSPTWQATGPYVGTDSGQYGKPIAEIIALLRQLRKEG
jgi:hypothetical protein